MEISNNGQNYTALNSTNEQQNKKLTEEENSAKKSSPDTISTNEGANKNTTSNNAETSKGEISETADVSKKKKKKLIYDVRDKNRDGKVSQAEKLEAELKKQNETSKTELKLEELNKQKVTPEVLNEAVNELQNKPTNPDESKKLENKDNVMGLVKDVISELKKEEKFVEVKLEYFKGITKMLNKDVIQTKESDKLNKFLDNGK